MKRTTSILAVLAAVLLVVSAAPVGATHVKLTSHNETASELQAGSITNADVERSGTPGYVGHDQYRSSAVARWAYDFGSGSTAYDHVASNDSSISGATWTSGKSGQALSFDSDGEVATASSVDPGAGTSTVTAWVNLTAFGDGSGNDGWIAWGTAGDQLKLRETPGGKWHADLYDASTSTEHAVTTTKNTTTGTWVHLAAVYDGTYLKLYVNGELAAQKHIGVTADFGSGDYHIGDHPGIGGANVRGAIDDPRIYSSALTPGQIARLAKWPNSKLSSTATERWGLDAGRADTAYGDEGVDGTVHGGDPDLAFIDGNNNLKYVNKAGSVVDMGVQAKSVDAVVDFDGDGVPDVPYVETGTGNQSLKYVDRFGNIRDTGAKVLEVGGAGDFDGDGTIGLAVRDANGNIKVVEHGGNVYDTGASGDAIGDMADFDADGDPDILFEVSGSIRKVDAAGNEAIVGGTAGPSVGEVADFDGDGDLDVMYERDGNGNLAYIDNAGNEKILNVSNPVGMGGVADFDNDGDPDVAYSKSGLKYVDASNNSAALNSSISASYMGFAEDVNENHWVGGAAGAGIRFDPDDSSLNDRVESSYVSGALDGDGAFSVWVHTSEASASARRTLLYLGESNWYDKTIKISRNTNDEIHINYGDDASATSPAITWDGGWHHILVTWDNSTDTTTFYVDGSRVGQAPTSWAYSSVSGSETVVGNRGDSNDEPWNGTLDEARLYTSNVSAATAEYLSQHPGAQLNETSSYVGAHSVTKSVEGFADLELSNATATITARTGGGTTLNSTTVSSSGNHSLTWSQSSADSIEIVVDVDATGPNAMARVQDDGVYANTDAPVVNDSSLSPNSTSETVSSLPVTLEAEVSDTDFGTAQGEELTLEWYLDGSLKGTTTATSNGTYSFTLDSPNAGEHDWHVETVDTDGHRDVSATASFAMPSDLKILNESNTSALVDNVTVEIRFYGGDSNSDFTVSRETSDGTIDMTGLPADEEFVVVVKADTYYNRRVYVKSLLAQQRVYLLPSSKKAMYNVFKIDDKSGTYPAGETRLIIQRGLNVSGDFQWVTVSGDFFGATNEHKTNLRYNQRYRLIVENNEGDRRVIGAYMATDEDNPKFITIKSIIVDPPEGQSHYGTGWVTREDPNPDNDVSERTLRFTYSDPGDLTDSLDLVIYEQGNKSNELVNMTSTDVGTSFAYTYTLSGEQTEKAWVIDWSAERDGNTIGEMFPVGARGKIPIPMDPEWLARFGLVALPIFAALASERFATIGAMGTTVFVGVLMLAGIWELPVVLWMAALVISVGGHLLTMSQRGSVFG